MAGQTGKKLVLGDKSWYYPDFVKERRGKPVRVKIKHFIVEEVGKHGRTFPAGYKDLHKEKP